VGIQLIENKLEKSMKKLIIIGAGGLGREVYNWALDINEKRTEWKFGGFLDKNSNALECYNYSLPIIGSPEDYVPNENDLFVCAIGSTKLRIEICRKLELAGANFATLIHNTAIVGKNTIIGDGCIICPRAVITTDVHIGKHVIINIGATVGHDAVIGDYCTLNGHVDVTGFVKLGKGVFMGSHASVIPDTVVDDFATIGAGSVAVRRVRTGTTVFGIPATTIAKN
jgi:sugar O-acyltransferase (sialic acid O-acetyltransferase NeuD family)